MIIRDPLLLLFTVSSLSTVAENVDIYDVSISYGTYNGSNLLAIVAVINSFCSLHFLFPLVAVLGRCTCPAERINAASRRNRPVCPLLMRRRAGVRDVGSGERRTSFVMS